MTEETKLLYDSNHVYREGYDQGFDDATEDIAKILDCFLDTASEVIPDNLYCSGCGFLEDMSSAACPGGRGEAKCKSSWRDLIKNALKDKLEVVNETLAEMEGE